MFINRGYHGPDFVPGVGMKPPKKDGMMPPRSRVLRAIENLPVFWQTTLMVMVALVATEIMVVVFYSLFFEDRLLLDMVLSGTIVLAVGYPIGYLIISQNGKLRRMTAELDRAARTDDLTGLYNRRTFLAEAQRAYATGAPGTGAVLYIDADHFKLLNDGFGHATGDVVLSAIGKGIRRCVREGEAVGRLGGEEFGVFLAGAGRSIAFDVAERIRRSTSQIGAEAGLGPHTVTVSIGVAVRDGDETLQGLMNRADCALYEAKQEGRNRVVSNEVRAA